MADQPKRPYARANILLFPGSGAQFVMYWPDDASLAELRLCRSFANFQLGMLIEAKEAEAVPSAGDLEYASWFQEVTHE